MPHKRAKRSVRERESARRATDLAPTISVEHEPVPKSASRVLDAGRIRREYRKKKRQLDGVTDSDDLEDNIQRKKKHYDATDMKHGAITAFRINPSETIAQFNSRVENSMMPLIKTALQQSSAQARKARKKEAAQETQKRSKQGDKVRLPPPKRGSTPPPMAVAGEEYIGCQNTPKEFQVASTSTPRRLNDIAQEPPVFKNLPRGASNKDTAPSGVLSMAQKAMMEEERNKTISHYRELKARRLRKSGGVKLDG